MKGLFRPLFQVMLCLMATMAVHAAELPYQDFTRHSSLANPVISPDGKHLAVSIHNDDGSYQLGVLSLPELNPVSRLNMAARTLPVDITWVSNTRLVMDVGEEAGTLVAPEDTGEVVAVDFDGSHKRVLYSWRVRDTRGANMNILGMVRGAGFIAGTPHPLNGHVYINVSPFRVHASTGARDFGRTLLYDVETSSGHPRLVGQIEQTNMTFVLHDDVARFAYGSSQDDPYRTDVYSRDNADDAWRRLPASITGKRFVPLRISTDGKQVYALYSASGGPDQLVISNLDGSARKLLASDDFSSVAEVLWTPYPYRPYGVVFNTGKPRITYLDDSIYTQVSQALTEKFPDEFLTVTSTSQDGMQLIIGAQSDRDPGTYALFDRRTMNLQPLFRSLPWIDPQQMLPRKPIRFTTSDGITLTGFLTMPAGSARKPVPLVLIPHGGPIGVADSWLYDPWAQFLANRGYAVLQVNYRGSGGRGTLFEHAGYKQFGTGIQQDLIDGVKWAIGQGYADAQRVCIFGASFGGYSALMAPIRAPGMFKCAVDYAGVSDYAIELNHADISRSASGRNYFAQAIGTDDASIRAVSPIDHLDKFSIPVLIIHGKDDALVPYQNATDLRSALDKAGKPYEWLVRDNEQHGFYSEANQLAFYQSLQAFLDKYIGKDAH
ncbi:prolyl oligopeptidase family serine peptidase [Rhodanobacter sp. AS-Z3]|uniref:alpha/beta hydrolase family protein n=1 Tax=Rhodanobacter sp. AS-Z3 TaxID=3031330 RepID=UPI002478AE2B|nr:prolyl oligopeptidase family serine peptidase [Rhodanobacter sp. AS-Z3]WEN16319.1 prolyl oligopeptidase family serine peptidase [Rhodanobacter sp. AS-Z3]